MYPSKDTRDRLKQIRSEKHNWKESYKGFIIKKFILKKQFIIATIPFQLFFLTANKIQITQNRFDLNNVKSTLKQFQQSTFVYRTRSINVYSFSG